MIILDTNVVSEVFRDNSDLAVKRWMQAQDNAQLFLTAITIAEIQRGAIHMITGKKQAAIIQWLHGDLRQGFAGRILPFDETAALGWGKIMSLADKQGRPRAPFDMAIAAIAVQHGMRLATRNVKDFARLGLSLINPWQV